MNNGNSRNRSSSSSSWLWRGLGWTAVIVGAVAVGARFGWRFFWEQQQRSARAKAAEDNLKQRFLQNQRDSDYSVGMLLSDVRAVLLAKLNVESLFDRLKRKDDESHTTTTVSKVAVWEEIKEQSMVRLVVASYAIALLTCLVRIQVNFLGRFKYWDSVRAPSKPDDEEEAEEISPSSVENKDASLPSSLSDEMSRDYLTLSWYFLNEGLPLLVENISKASQESLKTISVKSLLAPADVISLLQNIRKVFQDQHTDTARFADYLFPPEQMEKSVLHRGYGGVSDVDHSERISHPLLRQLLDETRDVLDSDDFNQCLISCVDDLFRQMEDDVVKMVPLSAEEAGATKIVLAKQLPGIAKFSMAMLESPNNAYFQALGQNEYLELLSSVVFSRTEDFLYGENTSASF